MPLDCFLRRLVLVLFAWLQRLLLSAGLVFAMAGSAQAQLVVTGLTDSPDPVPAGGTITYNVSVADQSGTARSGVKLFLAVPAGAQYAGTGTLPAGVSCSGMAVGQAGAGTLTCSGITIAAGANVTLPVYVKTTAQGALTVEASLENGALSQQQTTTVNAGADLALSVSAAATASAGSTQSVVLTVTNNGPNASPASTLEFTVNEGFSVGMDPSGCSRSGSTLTCVRGALAVGASYSVTVNGVIIRGAGSTVTHTANVLAGGGVSDGNTDNNGKSVSTSVTPGTTLSLTKTQSATNPLQLNQSFNFLLTPSYTGDFPTSATLTDPLPANFCATSTPTSSNSRWSCTVSSSCPTAGGTVTCTRGNANPTGAGENISMGTITVPVKAVASNASVTNTATVGAASASPVNASLISNVVGVGADLSAVKTKTWTQNAIPVGTEFFYGISAKNNGPQAVPAGGTVRLVDDVPSGLQITQVQLPAGITCDKTAPFTGPTTLTCTSTTGVALNGSSPSVTLKAKALAAGTITNHLCVQLSAGTLVDDVSGNNCVDVTLKAQDYNDTTDLSVRKRVVGLGDASGNRQSGGAPILWELEIVNAGPGTAANVRVSDEFSKVLQAKPRTLTLVPGPLATMGSCSLAPSSTFVLLSNCTIASLPPCTAGSTCPKLQVSLYHFSDVVGSTFESVNSTFSVQALDQADRDILNNNNTKSPTTAYLNSAVDLQVSKTANPTSSVAAGQLLTYTITVTNPATSPTAASNVAITDTLPAGVVLTAAPVANGGGSCTVVPTVGAATTAAASSRTLQCGWSSIARGNSQTVTVTVRALASLRSTSITNTVTVSSSTPELDISNNTATVTTAITAPTYDLLVNKSDDVDPADSGSDITYTLKVTNNGASTAENVVLVDTLPTVGTSGETGAPTFLSMVTPLPAGVSCNTGGVTVGQAGGTVTCSIAALGGLGLRATGEPSSVTLYMKLRAAARGVFPNKAQVRFSDAALDAFDSPTTNNVTVENTSVRLKTDLEVVSKQAVITGTSDVLSMVTTGQTFDWLVQLRNNGPADATAVSFTDALPSYMVLTGAPVFTVTAGTFTPNAPTCSGAAGGTAVSCDFTTMPVNGTATVRIPVRVANNPAPGTVVTNRASLVTTGSGDTNGGNDPAGGNNFKDGSVTVQATVISGYVYRDLNRNGQKDAGEPGIATTITLSGPQPGTTTSDPVTGAWSFSVTPGTYVVTEAQPAGYEPGITRAGNVGGVTTGSVAAPTANAIEGVVVNAGAASVNNLFGEYVPQADVWLASKGAVASGTDTPKTTAVAGEAFDFVVRVVNNGPQAAELVQFSDLLPTGMVLAGAPVFTVTSGSFTPVCTGAAGGTSVSCTIASMPNQAAGTVRIPVRLTGSPAAGTELKNTATIIATGTEDLIGGTNPMGGNNFNSGSISVVVPTGQADVQVLSKIAKVSNTNTDKATAAAGEVFDFVVEVVNNGSQAAELVQFSDLLPAGMVLAGAPVFSVTNGSFTPVCSAAAGGASVSCAIASMPGKAAGTVRIPVQLTGSPAAGTVFKNTATIVTTGTQDTNGGADPLAGNNFNQGSIKVATGAAQADVHVLSKVAKATGTDTDKATANPGEAFDWLVQLANHGPQAAETVQFRDTLPTGMVLAGAPVFTVTNGTFTAACTGAAGGTSVGCDIASMPADAAATVRIPVRITGSLASGTVLTNTATLVTTGTEDPKGGSDPTKVNNFASGSITLQRQQFALSGRVWRDASHNRVYDAGEPVVGGWTVQLVACNDGSTDCTSSGYTVKSTATTAADGTYRMENVEAGKYQLRFVSPQGRIVGGVWPTDPTLNQGANAPVAGMPWINLTDDLPANLTSIVNQDLPLDPGGVVYDSVTAAPVAGATVRFTGPVGFNPAQHLLSGSDTVVTDASGEYQFFLLPGAPAGFYALQVTPPAGYRNSTLFPAAQGALDMRSCTVPGVALSDTDNADPCLVSPQNRPALPVTAPYVLALLYPGAGLGAQSVVNNHLPLDRIAALGALIELRKSTPKVTVKKGEPVPYTITAHYNGSVPVSGVALVDTLPPGFKYLEGSLTVQTLSNGAVLPARPLLQGRQLTLENQSFAAGETKKLQMVLAVGVGVSEGEYVNSVVATQGGTPVSNTATAPVRVMPDALLDCTDVIGKVYDDRNANGWQDEGEPGLANVRIATVNGLLVNTDALGRYHIACAAVPKEGTGSNLVLKLDERTLPSGYRVTTENPAAERITRGKAVKVNFGATVHRVVRLVLQSAAFADGEVALKAEHEPRLAQALAALRQRPSILRLAYEAGAQEDAALGDARLAAVRERLLERWRAEGRAQPDQPLFNLDVEVERVPASTAPTRH